MVKGTSRQVILVQGPDPKLFEQAIFILRQDAQEGISDETLVKEANRLLREGQKRKRFPAWWPRVLWALGGAGATGVVWALTWLI